MQQIVDLIYFDIVFVPSRKTEIQSGQHVAEDLGSTFVTGNALTGMVGKLVEMGFPEDRVKMALRAADDIPDLAVQYLMTGFPAGYGGKLYSVVCQVEIPDLFLPVSVQSLPRLFVLPLLRLQRLPRPRRLLRMRLSPVRFLPLAQPFLPLLKMSTQACVRV